MLLFNVTQVQIHTTIVVLLTFAVTTEALLLFLAEVIVAVMGILVMVLTLITDQSVNSVAKLDILPLSASIGLI